MRLRNADAFRQVIVLAMAALVSLCTSFVVAAEATCLRSPTKNRVAIPDASLAAAAAAQTGAREPSDARAWLVGMWNAEFLIGDALYDQTLQQFHSDGNENMLSNGLPPTLGNVCLGIWTQVGPRTFKVRHMAWNWDAEGNFTGLFEMIVTFQVDRSGNRYAGTFIADSYDLSNNIIPELHAEGTVRATRITVN